MSAHLSEEEQIETLKRWWQDNGKGVVLAVIIGVGGYLGWTQFQAHQERQAAEASLVYLKLLDKVAESSAAERSDEQRADITYLAVTLKDDYSGSQYAYYGALMLAKIAVEQSDFDTAAKELQLVLDANADEGLKRIARLRLARVEVARNELDKALALLSDGDAGDLASAYAEVRGDIYQLQGDDAAAQSAYQEAISRAGSADERSRQLLELKLSRVSVAQTDAEQPVAVEVAETEDATVAEGAASTETAATE